jgi:alpha-ketoglutarate-dependent taurine dioxygenase
MPGLPIPSPSIAIAPIPKPDTSSTIDFGAVLTNVDCENLSDADFAIISEALYQNHVICIKGQNKLSPRAQAELTRRFDPEARLYGHGKTLDAKKSILHPDLKTIPHQPEVQVIGNGFVPEYEGLKDIKLKHPHHKTFHKTPIPEADDLDFTRFYRWHIDAALYELNPPLVTSLLAVQVPCGRRQTLRYDDTTNQTLSVPLGTTAFVSGYKMFDLLSPTQKTFALTSKIEYAPHPYIWMSSCKSKSDGLGLLSEGAELSLDQLPPIDESKICILPMCWRNPVTGQYALQIHPSAVRKIYLGDGSVIDDLKEVREIVHSMQRPGIAPELVYPHDWEEGDLVLFNNHGVLHSVVGAFREDEVRLFRQCNLAASRPPVGPDAAAVEAVEAVAAV